MKKYDIAEIFTDIDDKFIAGAKLGAQDHFETNSEAQKPLVLRPESRSKTAVWKKCAAAAACLAVVGGSVFAVSKIGTLSERTHENTTYESTLPLEKIYDSQEINAPKEEREFKMPEFPGTEFKVSELGDVFIKPRGFAEFVSLGLWNYYYAQHSSVYLFDVTCDGYRDICVASGVNVSVYDAAKDTVYSVSGNDRQYSLVCADDLDQMPVKSGVELVLDSVPPSFLPGADELGELREYPDSLYLIGATENDWETMVLGKNSIGKFSNFMTYAGAICIDWVTPPVIDNDDFEVTNSKIIANWERNNPVQIWDAADGEKTFTFEEFSELTVTINDKGVFFVNDRGDREPWKGSPFYRYYTSDIVKMYSAYTADIDGDGERELCVLADVKTADGYTVDVDSYVLYYDIWFSEGASVYGSRLSGGSYLGMEDGELFIDRSSSLDSLGVYRNSISGPVYHGRFNHDGYYDDGIMSLSYRIYNDDWCRVFDDFDNFNEPTILEDIELRIKEFPEWDYPDMKFKYNVSERTLTVKDGETERVIVSNVLALYLIDVNGDGNREFCATVSKNGDWRKTGVHIYDMVNDKEYLFSSDDIQYAVRGGDILMIRADAWKKTNFDQDKHIPWAPISEAILPEFNANDQLDCISFDQ